MVSNHPTLPVRPFSLSMSPLRDPYSRPCALTDDVLTKCPHHSPRWSRFEQTIRPPCSLNKGLSFTNANPLWWPLRAEQRSHLSHPMRGHVRAPHVTGSAPCGHKIVVANRRLLMVNRHRSAFDWRHCS